MATLLNIATDIRIMLVADSGTTRDLLMQGLKKLGLREITLCTLGTDSLKLLETGELYDLLICDRYLPDLNGLEILREIQESDKILSGSFMLVSAQIDNADVALAAELGCDAYLVKPFPMKELAHKITMAMKRITDASCLEAHARFAKNLIVKGKPDESIRAYSELIEREGEAARFHVGKARALRKTGATTAALDHLDRAIALNKFYVHAYQEKGICLLASQATEAALKQFETAIAISPNNPIRYEIVADVLYQNGQYAKAEEYLLRAIKLELSYPALFAQLGKALFAQKKPERAAQFFEKALRRDPQNTSFLNSLGICYRELGKVNEALARYNQALKINPVDVKVLFNKALCLIHQQEFGRARKTCELILKNDPSYEKATKKIEEIARLEESARAAKDKAS